MFLENLANKNQTISFTGSGAPHQNGVAERVIGVVVAMARTMMIYADVHQPEGGITSDMWPQALYYAVWIYNRQPQPEHGFTPL